jgi:Rod binding domain-containing protein
MDLAPISITPAVSQAQGATPNPAELAKREGVKKAAQDFEASFLSVMLGQMFAGVSTSEPFGGGAGEETFKSFMTDAMAKQMARSGGIGLAPVVQKEMLKLQGLS